MASAKLLVLLALISLSLANENEDAEQKKRATNKGPTLNSIPSGAQKLDYTYLYQQPGVQPGPPSQQTGSFYPNLQNNQYYNHGEQPVYQPQPSVNYIPQNTQQFVPLNFIPNPGYQAKYQVVPKGAGSLQLAILPQSAYLSPPPVYQQQQTLYPSQAQNVPQQAQYQQLPGQQYQAPQGYVNQPSFQFAQPYLGQSPMVVYAQPQGPLYNNYLYSNAAQQLYNYFQSNPQAKYQLLYGNQGQQGSVQQPAEYDKPLPGPITQSISKEDNDLNSNDFIAPAESSSSYKNSYTVSRGSSYKP